jgi:DNA-binding transcriptional LysR family regulator
MDTLDNLKALVAVVESGSFSEAARRAGLATSVVKKRIDQLEARVGVALLERSTRSMRLTDAGHAHLPRIRRAIEQVEEVLDGIGSKPAHLEGHLRVRVPTNLMAPYLANLFNAFQHCHPHLTLESVALDRPVNPIEEDFDVSIGMLPTAYHGVRDIGLCAVRRMVVAAPAYLAQRGHPRTPQDLVTHATLNYAATGALWNFEGPTGPMALQLEHRLTSNHGQHLLLAACSGMGITCLSSYVVLSDVRAGRLEVLLPDYPIPEFWIRMQIPEERLRLPRVQALTAFLQAQFAPAPPWAEH